MGKVPRPQAGTEQSRPARAIRRTRAWCGLALAAFLAAGCLGTGSPLFSAEDPSLQPPLETIRIVASTGSGRDSIPSRLINARNLMAALIWAQVNDTMYHQAVRVNREWPLRLDAPMLSTPPPEALLNVSGNGRGRFGMSLLFLFEDANGNGRYDNPGRDPGDPPMPGDDWLMGVAGAARIVYVSDSEALDWVRAHPPEDMILTVTEPSRLRVGFNLLAAVNVRDTVFHEYRILLPGGGSSLSPTRPDSGEYETLSHPRKICDGFDRQEWDREIQVPVGPALDAFTSLVTVDPGRMDRP